MLQDLEDLNHISIRKNLDVSFINVLNKFREKAKGSELTIDEITKEVEIVVGKRYDNDK